MPPLIEVFLLDHTATATHLTGVLRRDKQNVGTGALCLARTDLLELSPTSIMDTLIQASFGTCSIGQVVPGCFILFGLWSLAHIRWSQLFKHDGLICAHQLTGLFVMEVFPLITDVPVSLAYLLCGPPASL